MSKNTNKIKKEFKVYMIIIIIVVLIIAIGTGYINRMIKADVPDLNSLKLVSDKEASEFGPNHTNRDCVNASLKRLKSTDISDFKSRVINKLFLQQCLLVTKISPDLCNEILGPQRNPDLKTSRWVAHTCSNHPEIHNIVCTNTLEAVESHCGLERK